MKKDWKYYLGISLFVYSIIPITTVGILPFLGLSMTKAGAFALVFLTSGEICFWVAAALLGKEFLAALKRRLMSYIKCSPEPKPVGRTRHCIGVVLFAASFIPYYCMLIYLIFFNHQALVISILVWAMVGGELACMLSFYLLGGQFWEKLKKLFQWSGDQLAH